METKKFNQFLWLMIPVILLFSMFSTIFENNGRNNLYVYQAQAFLEGHLNIAEDINNLPGEVALSNGKFYNIFPPFPTVVLLPFVAFNCFYHRVYILLHPA